MPIRAKKICSYPGCRVLIPGDQRHCTKHTKQAARSKNRPGDPFYSSAAWKAVRDARRLMNPLCEMCEAQGIVKAMWAVDHILPRSTHAHLELAIENTRSLCEHHHNQRTARDR